MPKPTSSARRSAVFSSYIKLQSILERRPKLCPDTDPLAKAAGGIECYTDDGIEYLEHNLDRLTLRFSDLKGCYPAYVTQLVCIISLNATSSFPADDSPAEPFDDLDINFEFSGSANDPRSKQRVQYWHFDRNKEMSRREERKLEKEANKKKEAEKEMADEISHAPIDAHPLYHFQFGGRKMRSHAEAQYRPAKTFGHLVLLEAPRIAHPPLDAVLAFDFALSNFAGEIRNELLKEVPEYQMLLSEQQNRLWKPYHETLSHLWTPAYSQGARWSGPKIWPQFVVNNDRAFASKTDPRSLGNRSE